ncbi:transcriptional repressor CTCF-like [Argiope bruennichi]|uniref:transcriptional repressor CTCF-like n=1 Tax=Argiope bruennichi TaxID=94029 RepID=UPI0024951707|nr:transcriptional repressor CTCF-like [Argiope bruennichi]XP_055951234.1 transcriptional repressor CTCF-like [Argiope bruennichi]XP_055951235.1 transcriptional repressor CTCF-like [Argiope bruennichi]
MDELNHEEEEDASDIRNYLASFHKEIEREDADESNSLIEQDSDEECLSPEELCNYLSESELNGGIDIKDEPEDDPEYYSGIVSNPHQINVNNVKNKNTKHMRKSTAEIVRLGDKSPVMTNQISELSDETNEETTVIPGIGEELHIDDQQTLEMVAQFAEQAVSNAAKNSTLSGLDNGSSYQTVTIVPSDTNPGELSYVLFVSQAEDGVDKLVEDASMSVFNLNDVSEFGDAFLTKQVDSNKHKMRTIRLSTRRSQLVSQQHVCAYCSYTSPKRYLLSRHMKSHSDERPHKCGVCERGFKTLASLQNHVNTHTGTRPHPCKDCESCFTTSGELVRHIRYKHTHEKPHKCTECDYASVELSKLKRHMRCHTGERPYQCPHCTYASPDTYKLKRHLRIHTGEKPYECDICQTRFTQSNSLKAHKLIHSGNKPVFQCEYCPTTCGRKTDLRIHMEKLHSSDNPHRCKRCGKVFLDRYSYKIHVKSHDGEKCFKCDLCDYASISQRHLETHMLVHTDQKPFHCDECDLCFRQKQLLKRHKNLYHNPDYVKPEPKEKTHICAVCYRAFRHKGNLMRHFAVHDPDATISEKELAMQLGESRRLGDDEDGEDDEELKRNLTENEDQQVVVFEVIQLPPSTGVGHENSSFASMDSNTITLNGLESQGYSIVQSADDDNRDLFDLSEETDVFDNMGNISSISSTKITSKNKSRTLGKAGIQLKKKKSPLQSLRRGKYSGSNSAQLLKIIAEKNVPVSEDQASFLNEKLLDKEKELDKIRAEQIQKDLKECFGFNDDKEEDYEPFPGHLEDIS